MSADVRVVLLAGLVVAGCSGSPPPVPPSLAPDAGAHGALVRFGALRGYLARPDRPGTETRAEVWVGDPTVPANQLAARVHATSGTRVLLVDAASPKASGYLQGMAPPVGSPAQCQVGCALEPSCAGTCAQ